MKNIKRILLTFIIPLILAIICNEVADYLMSGKSDCNVLDCMGCQPNQLPCADQKTLLYRDIFMYCSLGLFLLAFVTPIIVILRNKPQRIDSVSIKFF